MHGGRTLGLKKKLGPLLSLMMIVWGQDILIKKRSRGMASRVVVCVHFSVEGGSHPFPYILIIFGIQMRHINLKII